ncbi:hypothetical protein SDC9_168106 [bioreactor metagenome]|uniref:Uncharacterized protein n=1 Tax=bioreactor metagenome TaxID=1076179 RepID=A0A645G1L2_9ZZZZ
MNRAIGVHSFPNVGCLQREYDVRKTFVFKQRNVLERALDHCLRRRPAVFQAKSGFNRSGIDADSNWRMVCLCAAHERANARLVANVAGVKAEFVRAVFDGGNREAIVKMNVRDDWNANLILDAAKRGRAGHVVHRRANDIAARFGERLNLGHRRFHVACVSIRHRLHRHRCSAADGNAANDDLFRSLTQFALESNS